MEAVRGNSQLPTCHVVPSGDDDKIYKILDAAGVTTDEIRPWFHIFAV